MYETSIMPKPDDSDFQFYLVEDVRQARTFVSAIVVTTDEHAAVRQVYAMFEKELGANTMLKARQIEMTKTEGILYAVTRK